MLLQRACVSFWATTPHSESACSQPCSFRTSAVEAAYSRFSLMGNDRHASWRGSNRMPRHQGCIGHASC
eukprot:9613443-Alexandrium_andersonii.AAC.1